ncbi:DinB family protein [Spongiactinospora sp. TRM90649]|uniref:DinB family protein n=1 Tax=Spongiactinospora sp. TRM90649 TaxID=3031114 RepID=UPI0023FA1DE4|nr:DinB family protein [Spongiactinospora sp. TRM90649]MDF5753673.1 DinB family protein [Spongiactinospora sp. TRM90649]
MSWTAPQSVRTNPPTVAGEREMLERWLDHHRQTLLHKCAGLTFEQLTERSAEPSSLTLLGLVRHMSEVERAWFRRRLTGTPLPFLYCDLDTNPDGDFDDVGAADPEADFATFAEEVELADAAAAGRSLEDTFFHPGHAKDISLRWVYVHMIEEYARHNGHADLLRERIDGVTGS